METKSRKKVILNRKTFLFDYNTTKELIKSISEDVRLLGIDGFYVSDNSIQPSMGNIIDFSLKDFDRLSNSDIKCSAIEFMNKINDKNMYFEIVL